MMKLIISSERWSFFSKTTIISPYFHLNTSRGWTQITIEWWYQPNFISFIFYIYLLNPLHSFEINSGEEMTDGCFFLVS